MPREEQELQILAQRADLIGREQGAADMLRSERYAGLLRVDRAAHALEHDRFLAEQIGDELGAVVIVDAEYLQDAGVRQEGAGAALAGLGNSVGSLSEGIQCISLNMEQQAAAIAAAVETLDARAHA